MRAHAEMKKLITLFLTACLLLSGCTSSGKILTQSDAGKTIEVKSGETFQVTLPGDSTPSFAWQIAADSTAPVTLIGKPVFTAQPKTTGAAGMLDMTFKAGKPGQGVLKLLYYQPWEAGATPSSEYQVNVIVH